MKDLGKAFAGIAAAGVVAMSAASPALARHDDRYRYGYGMHPEAAVQRCVSAVERGATGYHYGRADVTRITSVKHKRSGFDVKGYVHVRSNHRGGGHGRYDSGKFKCKIRYGRISDIDFSGIRGLY